jgi:hypothetical protein
LTGFADITEAFLEFNEKGKKKTLVARENGC